MNVFFQHKDSRKYKWHRPSNAQKSLIDFCIVSSDLFSEVLDVRVKRGAELSTDHQLVVLLNTNIKTLAKRKMGKEGPVAYKIKSGQKCEKTVCI